VAPFVHEIRVRYGEVDMQGVVFNAHYLAWVDDAMSAWLEAVGYRGSSWAPPGEAPGWDFMVRHATLDWRGSATFGDTARIACRVARWGTTSFDVSFAVGVEDAVLVEVVLTYVGVRASADGTPEAAPVPEAFRLLLGPAA